MMKEKLSYFSIKNSTGFLYIDNLNCIFQYKDEINKSINDDKIIVLAIIWTGKDIHSNINQDEKVELYKWFNSLMAISIGVINELCYGDLLELFMMCDIRLGGKNLSIKFPENNEKFIFNFNERCQLIMGKKRNTNGYENLLKTTINLNEIYNLRLINKIIDMDYVLGEVEKYVDKIITNKDKYQIRAIIKCFNSYKQFGINSNMDLLLEEEGKQFCMLILREYLSKEEIE